MGKKATRTLIYFVHTKSQLPADGTICENIREARIVTGCMINAAPAAIKQAEILISEMKIDNPAEFIVWLLESMNVSNRELYENRNQTISNRTNIKVRITGTTCGKCEGCLTVIRQLPLFESMIIDKQNCAGRKFKVQLKNVKNVK